ncbi:MAG: hypothetical protein GY940_34730, partial [bacterium]|nr:hypothetical protein [bacterium]
MMLKNKESRDSILLIFMAVITIAFLVYLFVPGGKTKPNGHKPPNGNGKNGKPPIKKPVIKDPDNTDTEKNKRLNQLNLELETELKSLYTQIITSRHPFAFYSAETLKTLPAKFENETVEKFGKFSFNDLKDIVTLDFQENYSNTLKFNLYLTFFLVKLQEEQIDKIYPELPWPEFQKMPDLSPYILLGNELQEDYQLLPLLFYFRQLTHRLDLYP